MAGKIANNLKAIRKEYGLTQGEFADILGVKRSTYAHQEKNGIPMKYLYRYSEIIFNKFGIRLEKLVSNDFEVQRKYNKEDIINSIKIIEEHLKRIENNL